MEEKEKTIELEITVKERTSWGLIGKTFSNHELKINRAAVIVEVIDYLSKNYPEDYCQAVNILRKKEDRIK